MAIWSDRPRARLVLLLGGAFAALISVYMVFVNNRDNRVIGWETEESARQPFKPGMILNGQPPADFEISFVKPGLDSPIVLSSGEPCEFVVNIIMLDVDSPNATIPPSFVSVIISKGKRFVGGDRLQPFAIGQRGFTYSGRLYAPGAIGNYGTSVEVKYVADALSTGQPKEFTLADEGIAVTGSIGGGRVEEAVPYQKMIKGPDLHVRR